MILSVLRGAVFHKGPISLLSLTPIGAQRVKGRDEHHLGGQRIGIFLLYSNEGIEMFGHCIADESVPSFSPSVAQVASLSALFSRHYLVYESPLHVSHFEA